MGRLLLNGSKPLHKFGFAVRHAPQGFATKVSIRDKITGIAHFLLKLVLHWGKIYFGWVRILLFLAVWWLASCAPRQICVDLSNSPVAEPQATLGFVSQVQFIGEWNASSQQQMRDALALVVIHSGRYQEGLLVSPQVGAEELRVSLSKQEQGSWWPWKANEVEIQLHAEIWKDGVRLRNLQTQVISDADHAPDLCLLEKQLWAEILEWLEI